MSRVYSLIREQQLKTSVENAWGFFSDPGNLQSITPSDLGFKVISQPAENMYAGMLIEYKIRPLFNIPFYWMTEITHVSDKKYFVDEQRFGPYSLWHHQHHFQENASGVMMKDVVHYKLPFYVIGDAANFLFVGKRLEKIFDHRKKVVEELFNS